MKALAPNPIDLLFGGMEKLGPGANRETLRVLRALPARKFQIIVDAGCGTGRQTLALARELNSPIEAIDSYEPFLRDLRTRAEKAGIGNLIRTHCRDMKEIPQIFPRIDLLWSEGAAYNIGFANALHTWATAINDDGFLVVSELSWLGNEIPKIAGDFFHSGYPDMRSVAQNIAVAGEAGYKVLHTHTLPREAWVEGYYDILEPRAKSLADHSDPNVRDFALETLKEIAVFESSADSYGYVFYVLQRA